MPSTAKDIDAESAVRLAKAMILDGRMPNPEDAHQQLEERLRRDRLGEPMEILQDEESVVSYVPRDPNGRPR